VTFRATNQTYSDVAWVMRIMIPRIELPNTKDACDPFRFPPEPALLKTPHLRRGASRNSWLPQDVGVTLALPIGSF